LFGSIPVWFVAVWFVAVGFVAVWFVLVGFVLVGMVLVGSQDSFGVVEVVGAGLAPVEVWWGDPFGSVVMGSFSGGPAGG
jgi:hypothetical protein